MVRRISGANTPDQVGSQDFPLGDELIQLVQQAIQELEQEANAQQQVPNQKLQKKRISQKKKQAKPKQQPIQQEKDRVILEGFENLTLLTNSIRWTSLPQVVQQQTKLAFASIREYNHPWNDADNSANILHKCFKSQQSLFDQRITYLPQFQLNAERGLIITISYYFQFINKIANFFRNPILDMGIAADFQKLFSSAEGKTTFTKEGLIPVLEYLAVILRIPSIKLNATLKQADSAMEMLNNLLKQINQDSLHKPQQNLKSFYDIKPNPDKSAFDDDVVMIDTSTKQQHPIQQEKVKVRTQDNITIQQELKRQEGFLKTNRLMHAKFCDQIIGQVDRVQYDPNSKSKLRQFARWYYAKKYFNKLWHELEEEDQKDLYAKDNKKNDKTQLMIEQASQQDLNIQYIKSRKPYENVYIDAQRYNYQMIKNTIIPNIQALAGTKANIQFIKFKGTQKINIKFNYGLDHQKFIKKWTYEKIHCGPIWKGISRWKKKVIKKPPKSFQHRQPKLRQNLIAKSDQ